nr:O-antigen ligase family protein [Luteimicrobium album]
MPARTHPARPGQHRGRVPELAVRDAQELRGRPARHRRPRRLRPTTLAGAPRRITYPAFWLFVLAIAATQSRQAIVGLGLLVLVVAVRPGQSVRHTKFVLLAVVPAAFFVVQVLVDQLQSGNQFNSAYQRISWYQDSLVVWNLNQWFGAGLRWWYSGRTPTRSSRRTPSSRCSRPPAPSASSGSCSS